MDNADFYSRFTLQLAQFIEAKREGIFKVDLRLRPYGNSGPPACSLQSFCTYYGPGGPAHSYEKLSLVRLRAIGGDPKLGNQVERLRDEYIYHSKSIHLSELQELREKQFKEKTHLGTYNAKFSPGALVDLEYTVQILQIQYSLTTKALRTPRIRVALEALKDAGILDPFEWERLNTAYDFFRKLINGLRMLRGSAEDLFLPPVHSDLFLHLARRMGYQRHGDLEASLQLYLEFQTRTAAIRTFVEKHLGRKSLPGPDTGNMADLVLSNKMPHALQQHILSLAKLKDEDRAILNLNKMAGTAYQREQFAKLAVLASDILGREPNPDMALNNWERFVEAMDNPSMHYEELLAQPTQLEILLGIFSRSQFLSNTLIRTPALWEWVRDPKNLHQERDRTLIEDELKLFSETTREDKEWLNVIRRFRKRDLLRIGTRDMYLGMPIESITKDLSNLADAIIQISFQRVWDEIEKDTPGISKQARNGLCILAFGKLGGQELNYSSDVDLVGIYDAHLDECISPKYFSSALEKLLHSLSKHTIEGHAYRVDFRLRPYGSSGELVKSTADVLEYYKNKASLWERQAALKMRAIAGNVALGTTFLNELKPYMLTVSSDQEIVHSIQHMRKLSMKQNRQKEDTLSNVKTGSGGIREIEFLVQGLQLIHAPQGYPEILTGNTLEGLDKLIHSHLLKAETGLQLKKDYIFLRRVEHYLQIMEDQQKHSLPKNPIELEALAKRMLGRKADSNAFLKELTKRQDRVRKAYQTQLISRAH